MTERRLLGRVLNGIRTTFRSFRIWDVAVLTNQKQTIAIDPGRFAELSVYATGYHRETFLRVSSFPFGELTTCYNRAVYSSGPRRRQNRYFVLPHDDKYYLITLRWLNAYFAAPLKPY